MLQTSEMRRIAAALRSSRTDGSSEEAILSLFRELAGSSMRGISRSHHQLWYRARVCNSRDGYSSVGELIYPPTGSANYKRASIRGARTLYAGWNRRVAMDEIHANEGDIVQLIILRVRDPIQFPCLIVGELQAIWNSGRSLVNSEEAEKDVQAKLNAQNPTIVYDLFVDCLISELFRTQVTDESEYITSAVISNYFLKSGKGGIMYPSVRSSHSINLAISSDAFDSNFEVLGTELIEINANHGYGLYACNLLKQTWEIGSDGTFVWNSIRRPTSTDGRRRDTIIPPDFVGWRIGE